MFNAMPESLKKVVLYYLERDDFISAKRIYDAWLKSQQLATSFNSFT